VPIKDSPILFYSGSLQCKRLVNSLLPESEYHVMSGHHLKDLPDLKALSYFHLFIFCPGRDLARELEFIKDVKRFYPGESLPLILIDPNSSVAQSHDLESLGIQDYRGGIIEEAALRFAINRQLKEREIYHQQEQTLNELSQENKVKAELLEEVSLKAQESERLKTAFLNNISHELRTPMNGILGFLEYLEDPQLEGELKDQFIKNIRVSSERLLNTLQDLIEISEIEAGDLKVKFESVNLERLVNYILKIYQPRAKAKGLELKTEIDLPEDQRILWSDSNKLKGILIHLLNNSLKFTETGGVIIRMHQKEDQLFIAVEDSGIGMNSADIAMIYEHFVQIEEHLTRKYDGLGLGLSICKAYSRCLNGNLQIDSEIDKGTKVSLRLPFISGKEEVQPEAIHETNSYRFKKARILLVDDDPINLQLLEKFLRDSIDDLYTVKAKNGVEAVAYYEQEPNFDLVLMDLKMPLMNGFEATRILRKQNAELPIIAQTAYAMNEDKERALLEGCNDFLSKPLNKQLFYQTLSRFITRQANA